MDHKSDTIYAAFNIKKAKNEKLLNSQIIIWTTTPWTIPANRALAYNENLKYAVIKIEDQSDFKDKQIIVAEDLLKSLIDDCSIKKFKKVLTLSGKEFEGTICSHPFSKIGRYDIPMLSVNFVTTEQGSGIVHCAPSYGPDDFNLCLKNNIKAEETVDDDGNTRCMFQLLKVYIFLRQTK